ncbi:hypothetical protein [Luteitalea sp.]|uniref:hypothetical protein n=1 Tax=Luteitalea sp. TaxID=2004800 RepID=UPI0025B9321E|nr:hypothetical protein [Luteitalea sp.]
MRYGRAAAIFVSLVAATWVTTAGAQPRQPTFRARTVVTELEVHVTDAGGRPVPDLTRDDFEVTEDGVSQVLIGVEASGQAAGATAARATAGATVDAPVPSPAAALPAGTVLRATNRRDSDPAFEALRAEKPLGVAVAAVVPSADLGLEAVTHLTAGGSKARSSVSVSVVDAPGAPLPPRDILEVLAIVVDMKGKTVTKAGGRAEVTATGASLATPDLALEPLKPGRYQLRVAVRSVALDRTGAVFLDLAIPQH